MLPEQRLSVLVVEDDADSRSLYIELLEEKFQVFSAGDGDEALAVFLRERPQLVITDQSLPKLSGTALALKVKEIAPLTGVVLISGHSRLEHTECCDAVLEKPIDLERLGEVIEKVCAKIRG